MTMRWSMSRAMGAIRCRRIGIQGITVDNLIPLRIFKVDPAYVHSLRRWATIFLGRPVIAMRVQGVRCRGGSRDSPALGISLPLMSWCRLYLQNHSGVYPAHGSPRPKGSQPLRSWCRFGYSSSTNKTTLLGFAVGRDTNGFIESNRIDRPSSNRRGMRLAERMTVSEFSEYFLHGHFCGLFGFRGETHRNGLLRIDGNGVENYVAAAALHVESIEQVLDADVMSRERRRIVGRESRRGACNCSRRIAVGGSVNQHDAAGLL